MNLLLMLRSPRQQAGNWQSEVCCATRPGTARGQQRWRAVLFLLVGCTVLGAETTPSAVSPSSTAAAQNPAAVLRIYDWPNSFPPDFFTPFEQKNKVKVVYGTFADEATLERTLKEKEGGGYDVAFVPNHMLQRLIEQNHLQKIDRQKVPNARHATISFFPKLTLYEPYVLPYSWGVTAMVIDKHRVQAALGKTPMPINPWDLMFNPHYTRKLRQCGIQFVDIPQVLAAMVNHWQRRDVNNYSPSVLAQVEQTLKAVAPDLRPFNWAGDDLLDGKKLCVAMIYSADFLSIQAHIREREKQKTPHASGTLPHLVFYDAFQNGLQNIDLMVIPRDAPNPSVAHAFINYLLDPAVAARLVMQKQVAIANRDIQALAPEVLENPLLFHQRSSSFKLPLLDPINEETTQRLYQMIQRVKKKLPPG